MMAFLSPLFLLGILAAAIPVVMHLLHRRAEPVIPFPAIRYLRPAPVEEAHKRRVRDLVLLALRVAALLLFAFAFARPYAATPGQSSAPPTLILVDTSPSLSAPGQFERVRAAAHAAVRAVPAGNAVGVATTAAPISLAAPLAADPAAAHGAIGALQPGSGATRYGAALARGAELLHGRRGRMVVVTDLQESGWEGHVPPDLPRDVEVVVHEVGGPDANLAITDLRVSGTEAVAVVRNYGADVVTPEVTFAIGDRRIAAVVVTVPSQGTAEARAEMPAPSAHPQPRTLMATVADRIGYAADNVRYAVIDPDAAPSVLVVTTSNDAREAFFLERALSIADVGAGFRVERHSGSTFVRLTDEARAAADVVVINGIRGVGGDVRDRLARYVRNGGGLLVALGPDVAFDGAPLNAVFDTSWQPRGAASLSLAASDSRHPIVRAFSGAPTLGNVAFRRAARLVPSPAATVIARYSDGTPALVEERAGRGRALLFASDLDDRWNDLPRQPVFVPFVHEMVRYLAGGRANRADYLAGDPGAAGAAAGISRQGSRLVAVNVDPRESNPARMTAAAFADAVARLRGASRPAVASSAGRDDGDRWWQAALALTVMALMAEGLIGRQTARGGRRAR